MSRFDHIEYGQPTDSITNSLAFNLDPFPNKINLGVAEYKTEKGEPWLLPCVKKAEQIIIEDEKLNHKYLHPHGYESFIKAAISLLLGDDCEAISEGRAFGIQSVGGSCSLRLAAEFLCKILNYKTIYVSSPTWENHKIIFKHAGILHINDYRYYNPKTRAFDLNGMIEDLQVAPPNSVITLQLCAHNPTGCDPTREQWKVIADIMQKKNLFPLFDSAFPGFVTGDVDEDSWSVRYFVQKGFELICCQTFSKTFGLSGERLGNITFVVNNSDVVGRIKSQLLISKIGMYCNPPAHGAKVVGMILNSELLKKEWLDYMFELISSLFPYNLSGYL